jgi:hypothetical protein
MRRTVAVAGIVVLCGCGGGGGGGTPTGPRSISVGGDYALAVALTENDCGSVTVQPLPTRVEHTPGAARLRLTHGPNTFDGSVSPDGTFTTDPRTLSDGAGTLVLTVAGRFTSSGLDALATVALSRPCRYVVRWTGTKQGAPNVLP